MKVFLSRCQCILHDVCRILIITCVFRSVHESCTWFMHVATTTKLINLEAVEAECVDSGSTTNDKRMSSIVKPGIKNDEVKVKQNDANNVSR